MQKNNISKIVNTAIISAFSIAAALIWKDVIIDIIQLMVPPREEIYYKVLAAIIATFLIVIAIRVFLKTEHEAEVIARKLNKKKK